MKQFRRGTLWTTSGAEGADRKGVKLDEGHLYCLNQRERNISLPQLFSRTIPSIDLPIVSHLPTVGMERSSNTAHLTENESYFSSLPAHSRRTTITPFSYTLLGNFLGHKDCLLKLLFLALKDPDQKFFYIYSLNIPSAVDSVKMYLQLCPFRIITS